MKTKSAVNKSIPHRVMLYVIDKDPMEVLASTPAAITRAVRGLADAQLHKPPKKGKWSITEIVSHLTDGEIVFAYRLRKILAEPGCKIDSYDQNKWASNLHYAKADCKARLAMFSAVRKSNVKILQSLSSKELKRFGIHDERGKEKIETMILLYAGHDMNHIKQIEAIRNYLGR
jgi:hypothetical protein